uniref:Uncharacterized protein n=1 Tax=Eptatretus burgeri TaxID=7764 RepID=A0A8C4WSM8_EPTBU
MFPGLICTEWSVTFSVLQFESCVQQKMICSAGSAEIYAKEMNEDICLEKKLLTSQLSPVGLPYLQTSVVHPITATVAPFHYRAEVEQRQDDDLQVGAWRSPFSFKSSIHNGDILSGDSTDGTKPRNQKGISNLRQDLEETMSCLRETQIPQSSLTCEDITLINQGKPSMEAGNSSWRFEDGGSSWGSKQAEPRLHAGEAPLASRRGRQRRRADGGTWQGDSPPAVDLSQEEFSEGEEEEDEEELVIECSELEASGYASDGDLLNRGLYSKPHGVRGNKALRVHQHHSRRGRGVGEPDSWEDSSSASSGLSDTIENISTDDLNTSSSVSSYPTTPTSTKKPQILQLKTDTEKFSFIDGAGSNGNMLGLAGNKLTDSVVISRGRRSENRGKLGLDASGQLNSQCQFRSFDREEMLLKMPGLTDDAKASEQSCLSPKQIRRRQGFVETCGAMDLICQPLLSGPGKGVNVSSHASSFTWSVEAGMATGTPLGGKYSHQCGTSSLVRASRKTSLDNSLKREGGSWASARTSMQYRSLPRPGKLSDQPLDTLRRVGGGRDVNPLSWDPTRFAAMPPHNQTDREKALSADAGVLSLPAKSGLVFSRTTGHCEVPFLSGSLPSARLSQRLSTGVSSSLELQNGGQGVVPGLICTNETGDSNPLLTLDNTMPEPLPHLDILLPPPSPTLSLGALSQGSSIGRVGRTAAPRGVHSEAQSLQGSPTHHNMSRTSIGRSSFSERHITSYDRTRSHSIAGLHDGGDFLSPLSSQIPGTGI